MNVYTDPSLLDVAGALTAYLPCPSTAHSLSARSQGAQASSNTPGSRVRRTNSGSDELQARLSGMASPTLETRCGRMYSLTASPPDLLGANRERCRDQAELP